MIVNIWMSWMSILAKKTPRKTQNNTKLKKTKYQNLNQRGTSFSFTLLGATRPLSVTPLIVVATLIQLKDK